MVKHMELNQASTQDILYVVDHLAALEAAGVTVYEGWITTGSGAHIFVGGPSAGGGKRVAAEAEALTKADIAKLNYRGGTKHEQDIADVTEKELAEQLGMPRTADNKPFDLQTKTLGVEVKTMVSNSNDKITMNKEARLRKEAEAKAKKLKTFTVVVDKRDLSNPRYFIKAGFGSFRVGSMTEVPSATALKGFMKKAGKA